jgi:hypothetical protein
MINGTVNELRHIICRVLILYALYRIVFEKATHIKHNMGLLNKFEF